MGKISGREHLAVWLEALKRQGKSKHTIASYRRAVEHFTGWYVDVYGAAFDPAHVMPRDVRDWKTHQQTAGGNAPTTVNQRLVGLSQFFKWAVVNRIAREDPTADVRSLPLPPRQPRSLSTHDLRRLLRAAYGDPRDYALIEVMAGTGLRVGELLALTIGDVTVNERSGKVIVRHGKRGNYREIPLTLDVRKALTTYLELEHPDPANPAAPLWWGQKGPISHRSTVLRMLNKIAYQARLDPDAIHPHTLRHTFATRYLKANPGDLRGLAALLGHSSIETVMIYTQPTFDDLAERMQRAEAE